MNIVLHELRSYRKATLIWAVSLAGLAALLLSMYPSFARDAETFKEALSGMPEEMLAALGLQIDSIASPLGYYSYVFLYVSLCGAIQAMHLGASVASTETREKTADFLLVKPVGRSAIISAKALAAILSLLFTGAAFAGVAVLTAEAVFSDGYPAAAFLLVTLSLPLLQLVFLAIGLAAAMLLPRMRTVLPVSLAVVFGFYALSVFGGAGESGPLRFVAPFRYFDSAYIVRHGRYDGQYLIAAAVLGALCAIFAFYRYCRRDVHVG